MRNHSTHVHSPQDDLIDFACSDTCRDDYAAQGLTYTADGSKPKARLRIRDWTDETDALHERNRELELEVRLLRLENEQLHRQARVPDRGPIIPSPGSQAPSYRGVDPDGIANH